MDKKEMINKEIACMNCDIILCKRTEDIKKKLLSKNEELFKLELINYMSEEVN